jgi:uncharacterized membrane protein YraQ (UPF0718 family)
MLLLEHFFELFLDAAPWLIGGLVIAGLIHSFVPTKTMAKHLGQDDLTSNVKAAIFGAPLPLCSCSVIPAAISLKRSGASRSATVSFLVSTPETGADSIAVSYALLGPFMAIVRPIAAILSAITAGLFAIALPEKVSINNSVRSETIDPKNTESTNEAPAVNSCKTSCCGSKKQDSETSEGHQHGSVSGGKDSLGQKLWQGQKYAFVDIFNDMAGWLLIGLLLAAMTLAWLPADFLTRWGGGFVAMVVMALVGIPMYICATASTPIAAGLLMAGISPGAVLVFLLAGPATNMATIGVVKRELGKRAVLAYLAGVLIVAFISGFATNWIVANWQIDIQAQLAASQHLLPEWLMYASATILALLIMNYGKQQLRKKAVI